MAEKYCFKEFTEDIRKAPNWLTFSRIAVFFILLFPLIRQGNIAAAFAVFLILAVTDFADGKLARNKNMVSWLGKGIDPVADKVLLVGTMCIIGFFKIYPILGVIIISLESILFLIGIVAFFNRDKEFILGANPFGKSKVILEIIVVSLLFIGQLNIIIVPNDLILFIFWAAISAAIMSILGHLDMLKFVLP